MIVHLEHGNIALNPDHVISVKANTKSNRIEILTVDQQMHSLPCMYNESLWSTLECIIAKLNGTEWTPDPRNRK